MSRTKRGDELQVVCLESPKYIWIPGLICKLEQMNSFHHMSIGAVKWLALFLMR